MAIYKDRVKETTDVTGLDNPILKGAVTGYKAFSTVGNGASIYYAIQGRSTGEFEIGLGTYNSSSNTITRGGVTSSSNSDALVPFSAGTKDIFLTVPAAGINLKADTSTVNASLALKADTSALPTAMDSATAQAGTSTTAQTVSASVLDGAVQYGAFTPAGTGAVSRTVQSKLQDVVSVKDFGAVGDGVTDDTAAIQAAISTAFASSTHPRALEVSEGWYRTTAKLTINTAHWAMRGETHRVIIYADHNDTALEITGAGVFDISNIDVRRVTGKTGVGIKCLSSPEGRFDNVWSTNHSDNVQIQDSHLTAMVKCKFSGATGSGINDLGRCFGSELIACNVIGNANGADLKSDWKIVGGAVEQNTTSDLLVSTTADYEGKYWGWVNISAGCHMEGLSGGAITTDQIVVGPSGASVAGPTAKIGLILNGSFVLGNSANRKAINFRQGDLCSVTCNYFKDYQAGATLITLGASCTGAVFQGNRWDGTGTFKSINASATNILDFETENTTNAYQYLSLTQSTTNGGRLRGVNSISSAARSMNLFIDSMRNSANAEAVSIRTLGADNVTLFSRISVSSGVDVGKVTFPSAMVEVSGSYTSPFKIGTAYFWMNAGKLYLKDGSIPTTATDGTIVGTQA